MKNNMDSVCLAMLLNDQSVYSNVLPESVAKSSSANHLLTCAHQRKFRRKLPGHGQ